MKNIKQKYKTIVKYSNLLINEILIKRYNKFSDLLINEILIKRYNKTIKYFHNKFKFQYIVKVSTFNKFLISLIALSFIYIFYLLIPTLYDKSWIQSDIENKLFKEFKINFSVSSKIDYEILPSPHFIFKNVKIIDNEVDNPVVISEIKKLKVFISQKNFFNKKKLKIKTILIDEANFTVIVSDMKFYKKFFNDKFSHKKIFVRNSNIFLRKYNKEIISIFEISKLFLFHDKVNFLNKFDISAKSLNVPFEFTLEKKFLLNLTQTKLKIKSKKLQFFFSNESNKKFDGSKHIINGSNILSMLNSKLISNYKIKKNLILFESDKEKLKNNSYDYKGKIDLNPFDLNLDINLNKLKLNQLLNSNSLLLELYKTKLLLNKNISAKINININKVQNSKLFNSGKIILSIDNGKFNFNRSTLYSNKMGSLIVDKSELSFKDDNLILSSRFIFKVDDPKKFYSFFQIAKDLKKPIKKIFIDLNYNFFDHSITLNNFKIDDRKSSQKNDEIIDNYNDDESNNLKNFIKNRNFLNKLFANYDG